MTDFYHFYFAVNDYAEFIRSLPTKHVSKFSVPFVERVSIYPTGTVFQVHKILSESWGETSLEVTVTGDKGQSGYKTHLKFNINSGNGTTVMNLLRDILPCCLIYKEGLQDTDWSEPRDSLELYHVFPFTSDTEEAVRLYKEKYADISDADVSNGDDFEADVKTN